MIKALMKMIREVVTRGVTRYKARLVAKGFK
jgi:hypothetical protein